MLGWAGDRAASRGAGGTGPKASHESLAGNSRIRLPVLHFLAVVCPPPPFQLIRPPRPRRAFESDHQRLPALPRACSCRPHVRVWACRPRRASPVLASSEVSRLLGHGQSCCAPRYLYLSLHLAWLSPHRPRGISLSFYKTYPAWREGPSPPLHSAVFSL